MNGTIECQSEIGKGTTFIIALDIPIAERQMEELYFDAVDALIADDDPILLDAAAELRNEYPEEYGDLTLAVAGNSVIGGNGKKLPLFLI